jgi:hypothetical protein
MKRYEIAEVFTKSLKEKLINTFYNDKLILDVSVEVLEIVIDWDGGGRYEDVINIKVLLESKTGKTKKWENYYYF